MESMKEARLPDPLNIRLPQELKRRIESIATVNHLTTSDIVRMVLSTELPRIEAGVFTLRGPN